MYPVCLYILTVSYTIKFTRSFYGAKDSLAGTKKS